MPALYTEKTALITGGSSGIGLALALQLAGQGAHVWLLARTAERLSRACEQVMQARLSADQRVECLVADVSDPAQVQTVVQDLLLASGAPDYLFNCAGVAHPGYVEQLEPAIFREMMEINYFGTLHITQALLPALIQRGSGHIVNFGSVASYLGLIGYSAYSASKYAVRGYSDVLRLELAPYGVHVSIVFPSDTDSPQLTYENRFKPAELLQIERMAGASKVMTTAEVARLTLRGVARGAYQIFPGSDSLIFYRLQSLAMGLTYPVLDWMLRVANRRLGKKNSRPAQDTTT